MKRCKLEYMIKNMDIDSKKRLVWKIDLEGCRDFDFLISQTLLNIDMSDIIIKNIEDFKKNYIVKFLEMNQICIENDVNPLFSDPYNLIECEKRRLDLIEEQDEEYLNEYFKVDSFDNYNPKKLTKIISYPAIFEIEDEWYNVTVPDIFGGVTCGQSYDEAVEMAKDMIKLMLNEAPGQCFPPKSKEETQENFPDKLIVMIDVEVN